MNVRPIAAILSACVSSLTFAPAGRAQPSASPRVVLLIADSTTRAAVPNVRVAHDSSVLATSDQSGRAAFQLPVGARRLTLTRLGYAPRVVALPDTTVDSLRLSVVMTAIPQELKPVAVRDSAAEFVSPRLVEYERRRTTGRGVYITREAIEKKNRVRTIDLFRGYPSFRVIDSLYDQHVAGSRGSKPLVRGGLNNLVPCVFRVAVDGVIMPWGFQVNIFDPKEIHGIEVYSGPATIPAEFATTARDAFGGVVLIWTRSRE